MKLLGLVLVFLFVTCSATSQNVAFSNLVNLSFKNDTGYSNLLLLNFGLGKNSGNRDSLDFSGKDFKFSTLRSTKDSSQRIQVQPSGQGQQLDLDSLNKGKNSKVEAELEGLGVKSLPKYYALLIGVSNYKNSNEKLTDLENPIIDTQNLANTLEGYFFQKENLKVLANPTRSEIIDELEYFAQTITEKDNFLIFYAGHGFWDERLGVGYWLPSDAQLEKKSSWLSNSNLKDYLAGIKAKHTLLISDACFSGSIFKAREVVDPLSEYGVSKLYRFPSRKAMTSGNLNTTPDKSKFFEFLNKRLLMNDAKYLSSRELFYSLYNAVINNTRTIPQYGVIQDTGDEGGDFIFIKKW